jgi:CRISPR-associated protein Csd1
MLSQPDPGQVAALLRAAREGRPGSLALDTNAFYCVALAGNSGRIAIRDWIDTTVPEAQASLARYFQLQRIVDRSGAFGRYFGVNALANATLREGAKNEQPSPLVPHALMHVALHGGPLPDALLAQVVRRIQADGALTHARAALIKMVLASQVANADASRWETYMAELDGSNREPAYLCGRLLAVLDSVQRAALGERNATIIDRFFGAASTAPVAVFGRLIQGAQPHLGKLRRERPNVYAALDSRLQSILADLDTFPRTLNVREQGLFALGFYHQRAADMRAARERAAARRAGEDTTTEMASNEIAAESR